MQEKPVKCYHGVLLLFINLFFSFILLIAYNTGLSRDEYVQITSCKYSKKFSSDGE